MNKKVLLVVVLGLVLIVPVAFVSAADYLPKDKNAAASVVVSAGTNYRNLYVGGGSVLVNAPISGDLFAAGGSVNVAAKIGGDLFAASGNVTVASPVAGDARLGGGNVVINAPVSGDVLVAGGTVLLSNDASVGGDLWIAGGMVNLTSDVAGNVKLAGGEVFINGEIAGQLEVRSESLVFGPQANVSGPIFYRGTKEAVVQDGARIGQIDFALLTQSARPARVAGFWIFTLLKFLALLASALILYRLFRKTSKAIVSLGFNKFWSGLGIGLVGIIATPIIAVILMITVVGSFVGIILLLGFMLAMLVSALYTLMLLGAVLEKWIRREKEIRLTWLTVLWGAIACTILCFIPFVGGLVIAVFYLATFGTLLRSMRGRLEA